MHRLYKYVNVSAITGQASFSIRPSKPSKSRVQDCLSAQRLFEISKVVTRLNIKDDLKSFESIYFFTWPQSFSLDLSFNIIFSAIVKKWLFKSLGEMLVICWDFDTCFLVNRSILKSPNKITSRFIITTSSIRELNRSCHSIHSMGFNKATTVWRARAGSQETGPPLQTFQGHSESRLAMVWHPTNWTGCYCSGQTALAHTLTICVICARERASPSSTVRQRTPPLGSLYPSDKCELPVPRLRTALQVQDRPAEPLPYPQIRGTDNVILETEGPPWWWWGFDRQNLPERVYCVWCWPLTI